MKIVHLMLACFYIDNYSYQENYLPKYHRMLGHDVEIIASRVTFDENGRSTLLPKGGKYLNEYNIPVTRLEYAKGKLGKRFRYYVGLKEELERAQPDLIFIHGVQFMDVKVVAQYCKSHSKVKVYADNHSDFSNSAKTWSSRYILHRFFWKRCAQKINKYVVKFYGVLPARVEFLKSEYKVPENKIELLVMGADDECVEAASRIEVRHKIRAKYNLSEDDFVVMTGGKIDAYKTQTLLLMEAISGIDNPKIKLIVFGSVTPDLKERVHSLADGKKIQYIGWVQSADSYEYFAASDLVVFPGRHSVFWEQVAGQGIPMICKYWEGTTHVNVEGNVTFLHDDSVKEIKENIEGLVFTEKYRTMKESAKKAKHNFLYSDIAKTSIGQERMSTIN